METLTRERVENDIYTLSVGLAKDPVLETRIS
jgi:hypothetical protein